MFRRANPFLGGTINKRLQIIPRINQGPENPHVIDVDHLEEIYKHLVRFLIPLPLCIERQMLMNASQFII